MNMYMYTEHTQSAALHQGEGHTNALPMYNPMVVLISRRVLALWGPAAAILWTSSPLVDGDMGRVRNMSAAPFLGHGVTCISLSSWGWFFVEGTSSPELARRKLRQRAGTQVKCLGTSLPPLWHLTMPTRASHSLGIGQ